MGLRVLAAAVATAAIVTGLTSATTSAAMRFDPSLRPPSLLEDVACRTVRTRVVRPGGRVVFRTQRTCGPSVGSSGRRCRVMRERVVRPGGTVVRSVRRCR